MNSDCNRENRKLLKRKRINDREELMKDMKLGLVLERKGDLEETMGEEWSILKWGTI